VLAAISLFFSRRRKSLRRRIERYRKKNIIKSRKQTKILLSYSYILKRQTSNSINTPGLISETSKFAALNVTFIRQIVSRNKDGQISTKNSSIKKNTKIEKT